MTPSPEPLWTIEDMIHFLQISRTTLFRMVKKGEIPHVRIGKKIYFIKEEIWRWIKSKEQGGVIRHKK